MKLFYEINKEIPADSVYRVELEEGETVFGQHSAPFPYGICCGTLYLPEGIETIDRSAFYDNRFHTIYFPKSLRELREHIFSPEYYSPKVTIVYPGTSEEFKAIATVKKEEVLESDGFDRYPYYSGGSRWVTYYRCFDNKASDVEVVCADGITLLYGSRHRQDEEEPKVKLT